MSRYNAAWVKWSGGWKLVGESDLLLQRAKVVDAPHATSVEMATLIGQTEIERSERASTSVTAGFAFQPGQVENPYRGWRPGDIVNTGAPGGYGSGGVGEVVAPSVTVKQDAKGRATVIPMFEATGVSFERKVEARLRARLPGFLEAAAGNQSEVRAEDQTIFEGPAQVEEFTWGYDTLVRGEGLSVSAEHKVDSISRLVELDATLFDPPVTGTMTLGLIAADPFSWRITRDIGELPMTGTSAPIQLVFPPGRRHAVAQVYDCVLLPWQKFRIAWSDPHGARHLSVTATTVSEASR